MAAPDMLCIPSLPGGEQMGIQVKGKHSPSQHYRKLIILKLRRCIEFIPVYKDKRIYNYCIIHHLIARRCHLNGIYSRY